MSATRSCQIAIALRPRLRPSSMASRYGSQEEAVSLGVSDGDPPDSTQTRWSAKWPVLRSWFVPSGEGVRGWGCCCCCGGRVGTVLPTSRWSPEWPVLPVAACDGREAEPRYQPPSGRYSQSHDVCQSPAGFVVRTSPAALARLLAVLLARSRHCSCRRRLNSLSSVSMSGFGSFNGLF